MVLHFVGEYVAAFLFKTLHHFDEGFFVLEKIPNIAFCVVLSFRFWG